MLDTIIIGSGISGLSAGYRAKENNLNFRIITGDTLGGKLSSTLYHDSSNNLITIEYSANILVEKPELQELIKKLNLEAQIAYTPKTKLPRKALLNNDNNSTATPPQIIPFSPLSLLKAIIKESSIFSLYKLLIPTPFPLTKAASVYDYTNSLFNSPTFNQLISAALKGTYGIDSRSLALSLVAPKFYEHLCHYKPPIWYLFKKQRPKIFSLKSGNDLLVKTLAEELKEQLVFESCIEIKDVDKTSTFFTVKTTTQEFTAKKIIICTDNFTSFLSTLYPTLCQLVNNHPKTSLAVAHLLATRVSDSTANTSSLLDKTCLGILSAKDSTNNLIGILQPGAAFPHMQSKDKILYNVFYSGDKSNLSLDELLSDLKTTFSLDNFSNPELLSVSTWKDAFPYYSGGLYKIIDEINRIEAATYGRIKFNCFYDGKGLGVADRVRISL